MPAKAYQLRFDQRLVPTRIARPDVRLPCFRVGEAKDLVFASTRSQDRHGAIVQGYAYGLPRLGLIAVYPSYPALHVHLGPLKVQDVIFPQSGADCEFGGLGQ